MKCARCSAEIPSQSQFCLRCGTAIHNTAVNPTGYAMSAAMAPPRANNRPLLIILALLALAVLGLGAYVAKGLVQKPGTNSASSLVQAPGSGNNSPLVQAPGESNPAPVVQAPGDPEPAAPRPADIEDYLAFLKRIEEQKHVLNRKQLRNVLLLMTQAQSLAATIEGDDYDRTVNNLDQGTETLANEWEELTREFNSRTPPASCVDLRNKYFDHMAKIQGQMVEMNDIMNKIKSDPQKALDAATQMKGRASAEVDEAVARADDALAEVCNRYRIHKDFDIKSDPSSSTSMFR